MSLSPALPGPPSSRAAQYVRMSTEHQKYSLENQVDAIALYAAARNIAIVRTYADTARSGLSLAGRPALMRLLEEAQSGTADFSLILVYDVSRWGRFQDIDESAHHEFLCRVAGVSVRYCAEPFEDTGSPASILKVLKRVMAAEFSRELSAKVFAGQCAQVRRGFRVGSGAPYGFRRLLLDERGHPKFQLGRGQHKNIKAECITLIPGPAAEVNTVRRVFDLYAAEGKSAREVAAILNGDSRAAWPTGPWGRNRVRRILINEAYAGNLIFGRRCDRVGMTPGSMPRETWVRYAGAFEPIVDEKLFNAAQARLAARTSNKTDAQLLAALSGLYKVSGRLNQNVIARAAEVPKGGTYRRRFGSLGNAYALIGHPPPRRGGELKWKPALRQVFLDLKRAVIEECRSEGVPVQPGRHGGLLLIDGLILRLTVAAARRTAFGSIEWRVKFWSRLPYDAMIVARMDAANANVLDYFLLPNRSDRQMTVRLRNPDARDSAGLRLTSLQSVGLNGLLRDITELREAPCDRADHSL